MSANRRILNTGKLVWLSLILLSPTLARAEHSVFSNFAATALFGALPKVESSGWRTMDEKEYKDLVEKHYARTDERTKELDKDSAERAKVVESLKRMKETPGRAESFEVECIERQFEHETPEFAGKPVRYRRYRAVIVAEINRDAEANPDDVQTKGKLYFRSSSGRWPEGRLLSEYFEFAPGEAGKTPMVTPTLNGSLHELDLGRIGRMSVDTHIKSSGPNGDLSFNINLEELIKRYPKDGGPAHNGFTNYQIQCH